MSDEDFDTTQDAFVTQGDHEPQDAAPYVERGAHFAQEGARYVEPQPQYAERQPLQGEGTPSRVQPTFVRQRAPHRTQEAIDDLAQDGASLGEYTHDSNVSVRGGAFSGRSYRRARTGMGQVKGQGNRYSQYLEIPKGRRTIFVTQQRMKRRQSLVSMIAVVTLILVAVLIIWALVSSL